MGEFIVVSVGFYMPNEMMSSEQSPSLLSVMLIERARNAPDVAFRVQLCSDYIALDVWRSTAPKWRLINLA